ncbi:putative toxin-antitoxin system toxin component, PIN family [Dehalococcoidia bacterium]|nr:putative toxin-antitoxin system toxin component, PIN family [Dehalococcoidia bacterium]
MSGLLWEGLPNRILTLIRQGEVTLCLSPEIVEEVEEVIKRDKFKRRVRELETKVGELVSSILAHAKIYSTEDTIEAIEEDPDDNMFLSCALYAGAEYIVSGDKHLLNLGFYGGVRIFSPREFLDEIMTERT